MNAVSFLFMPGNQPGMLQSGDVLGAGALIFDLEDAVSLEEKDAARDLAAEALRFLPRRNSLVSVRINPTDSPYWQDDLKAVLPASPDAIVVPKATLSSLKEVVDMIGRLGFPLPPLWPLLETPLAIVEAAAIASLGEYVEALLLGGEDYATMLGVERTEEGQELLYARMALVTAAAAYGKAAIDTPFTEICDDKGLEEEIRFVRGLGFTGKLAIHPGQVEVINSGFMPAAKEIEWAEAVLAAAREAKNEGRGAFTFRGKMVDKPVLARAEKILEKIKRHH
jgi:citrate lyase subunit beta/citryl-CoA lyase